MIHITRIAAVLLLTTACAWSQKPQDEHNGMVDAARRAKLTLVDAVQKASAVVSGTVVRASLRPAAKPQDGIVWQVHVLSEGRTVAVTVDAVSGAVGKPTELTRDDDDKETREARDAQGGPPTTPPPVIAEPDRTDRQIDFESVATGTLPTGWIVAETAGAGKTARWRVEETAGAPSGKRVLCLTETRNSGATFNILMSAATFPADLDLAVRIHADSGNEDQGGGLIWRAQDADNYYVARWNPLEDNLRAYKVVGGKRSMLESVAVKTDATRWHTLGVHAKGPAFEVSFDGTVMITVEDSSFAIAGKVGVWTKADAASSFDDLEMRGGQ